MDEPKERREIDLSKVRVKLVTDYFERGDVEAMLDRHHPLGAKKAKGARLCYSASYRGEWIAVLLFDSPVLRNKLRELRIGWTDAQRSSRLEHVANNSRYLIAPRHTGTKNLASKILSLVTDRISKDWQRRYGVSLLAVETYVDPQYHGNTGGCYAASGWENLGFSTGYQPFGEERTHGKLYFLKALHKDSYRALCSEIPHALMTGVKEVSGESNNNYVLDASKFDMQLLQKDLEEIPDPRSKSGQRYPFVPFLSLCIAAVISGYTQYRQIADWISKLPSKDRVRFGFRGDEAPHENTVGYFLRKIDPENLHKVLSQWLLKTYGQDANIETILLDGKAQRGTSWSSDKQKAFLNVVAGELGIVIEHKPTTKGGGEKITAREFLESDIDLENKIIIADAIHTDRAMLENIKKKEPRMSSLLKVIKEF